ncbi:unnamed protein product, partial [Oppiella nova]
WDTKKVMSDRTTHITYNGTKLSSGQRAYWVVRVWDQEDRQSDYSSVAFWDKGLDISDWTAEWVGAPNGTQHKALQNISEIDANVIKSLPGLRPVLYLRKDFTIDSNISSARLYASSQGVHKIQLNGKYIGDDVMSPGWTDYNITVQYQTYDVKAMISSTQNVLDVKLGTGWFSAYIGAFGAYNNYGSDQYLLLELHITYENNKTLVVKSDNTWKVTTGAIMYSDIIMGELYYQNRELSRRNDTQWTAVVTKPIDKKVDLIADRAQPIRVTEELTPKSKRQISPGVWILDFEQDMAGWVAIKVPNNQKSLRIQLRHAEALNPNGTIYKLNYRTARSTDTYVIEDSGASGLMLEPHFTYHGFRYIEVTGFPGEPQLTDFVGRVAHTDTPMTGMFESDNKLLNRLWLNVLWSQTNNIWSIPHDCPQRDERLGWTGSSAIFVQTVSYNADVSAIYSKWLRDLREARRNGGHFSDVAPRLVATGDGGPSSGDSGVIVPYHIWHMFGDIQILDVSYESMKTWVEFIQKANPDYLWTKGILSDFGDWLEINAQTPKDVFDTCYFGYDALLMTQMAGALNRTDDAKTYHELHTNISNAFTKAFVNTTDGKIKGDTQAVYVLALAFELLPQNLRPLAVNHLVDNIKAHDYHYTTGFSSVNFVNEVLVKHGHRDVAYKCLLQETFPSFGYEIGHNATSIWERWDTWTEDKGFMDPGMNSFNHFGMGSIGRSLYQYVAGIDTDDQMVGFKRIKIQPNPGNGVSFVKSSYKSINGFIENSWQTIGNQFVLNVMMS